MATQDNYLDCKLYSGHELNPEYPGFATFQIEGSEDFFFAYLDNTGKVLLRSEGYVAITSRTKGIESIQKNIKNSKRFAVVEEAGKFYIILKAGNHREIGRSCSFKTKAEAEKGLTAFETGSAKPAKTASKTKTVTKAGTESKEKTPAKTKSAEKEVSVLADVDTIKVSSEVKESAKKEIGKLADIQGQVEETASASEAENNDTDGRLLAELSEFLEVHEYLDKPRIWDSYGITGYVKFQAWNGKHYFGVYNPDATLYLRSKGFESDIDRDAAFDLMDSIILLEENYKIENFNGRYYAVLFDDNEIVAVSSDFGSFIEAFVTTPGGRPREVQGTMY